MGGWEGWEEERGGAPCDADGNCGKALFESSVRGWDGGTEGEGVSESVLVVHGMPEVQQSSGLRLGWTEDFNQQLFVDNWPAACCGACGCCGAVRSRKA